PGFAEYYKDRCAQEIPPPGEEDRELLAKYRPKLILPPGGSYPIDFYRDYLPFTVLRNYPDGEIITRNVTPEVLAANVDNQEVYLDFQRKEYQGAGLERKPVIYGRVYREAVSFPTDDGFTKAYNLTFLKYNIVFATSGLAAKLPLQIKLFLAVFRFDLEDWHELDNFVAVHIVLDEDDRPIAVILAQHNNHRTFLLGRDLPLPEDGWLTFDIALRSNEIYPASDSPKPVEHRVIRWNLYMKYLLSGEDPPFIRGMDLTYGKNAGGREIDFDLVLLSPCDPLYTARILLGEPRPFLGKYIGRDGPPGSDYYNVPELLPMGAILKFAYLHDNDPDDIAAVEKAIDIKKKTMDIPWLIDYGGRRFFAHWQEQAGR
ncbi:MAG: hypothetical protein ACC669_09230, partial [bacterium]